MIARKKKEEKNMMHKKMLLIGALVAILMVSTVFGAYLTYKGFVEIYGTKYPLGIVELETHGLHPIEGLEAGEQHIGEIRVWTYSNNSELVLQLQQLSQIVTNFRSFTVKVCLPLDIIFVVDVTGSMTLYMATVKAKLIELMGVLVAMNPCPVEVGVVAFKDYAPQTTSIALTNNYAAVETFINGLTAQSGAGIAQSHYLGFEKALELFHGVTDWLTHDRVVVFVSDAQAGFADVPEWDHAQAAAWALANEGVKIHSVLCGGPTEEPELTELKYYSGISAGNFIINETRIVPGVTRDPTWIVKLTPITPFDSFRMKLNSSTPTMKKGYYSFQIFVDYFCKAVPWHEYFMCELSAHLEHAELPPYTPPPPPPEKIPPRIEITLGCAPISVKIGSPIIFNWIIPNLEPDVTPTSVKLYWQAPATPPPGALLYTGTMFPADYTGSKTYPAIAPAGTWYVWLYYEFTWNGNAYTTGAFAMFTVTP
jgi:hypothetical protein